MKSLTMTLAAVSVCLMVASPAFASHHDEKPVQRSHAVQHTAPAKHRSDHQSRQDAKRFERERRELRQLTRRFYRDGYLSEKERRILNRRLHALNLPVKQPSHKRLDKYVDLHNRYGHQQRVCEL